jgi:hypothetical protein
MTVPDNVASQENKQIEKEANFRNLEAKYKRELELERNARLEAERNLEESKRKPIHNDDDEDDPEPYIDKRKLNKTLAKFGQSTQSDIKSSMEAAKQSAKEEIKREIWLENNPDFYEILKHAEKLAERSPHLANTILRMPEGFERQQLVYHNIKELGLHKAAQKEPSIQEKIDANRKSPYYQSNSVGAAPYSSQSDFSPQGQAQAYEKMKELKSRMRLG